MSRIGKLPINIPENVKVSWDGIAFKVEGKFGKLDLIIPPTISINQNNSNLELMSNDTSKKSLALFGLYRTLVNNALVGVSRQFHKNLVLKGVGFKATLKNGLIILNLGYSHQIKIKIPENIDVEILQNNQIKIRSCNKELLGLFSSNIRSLKKPEPYKGKGILFEQEKIVCKIGKSSK